MNKWLQNGCISYPHPLQLQVLDSVAQSSPEASVHLLGLFASADSLTHSKCITEFTPMQALPKYWLLLERLQMESRGTIPVFQFQNLFTSPPGIVGGTAL